MSFVGVCSVLYTLEDDSEGVKVTDLNNIFEYMQREKMGFNLMKGEDKRSGKEYPFKYYRFLYGFSSYDADYYRLENFGYEYCKEDFIKFWEEISKCTEPFYFYHSPHDGAFRDIVDIIQSKNEYVYKVVCVSGNVEVHRLMVDIKHG